MTGTRFNQSKEIFGLSIANVVAGIMGGTPCTGVLVRTGVNVTMKATDKMSQFLNAVAVLLITLIFMPAFVFVPLPCIAAILIVAASRLIPFAVMSDLLNYDIAEFVILIVTCLICVFVDGAVGLMVGGVVSILRTAIKTSQSECCQTRMSDEGTVLIVSYSGQISYVNALQAEKIAKD